MINPLKKILKAVYIIWKGGKRVMVVVVNKYNPAKQNVESFKSTTRLTFSGLGTQH